MLDVEQILSNVDLGTEAPSTETATETTVDSTPETEATEETTADGQVTERADESQGTEQSQDETPKQPAKDAGRKDTVPLAVHLDTKHKLRGAQMRLAELEARQMVAAQQQQAKPAEAPKGPMEKFIETEGGDAVPPAKVLMEQRRWEQAQGQQQQTIQASNAASQSVAVALHAMTDETMGDGLGFETVLLVGNGFLTEGDKLDVRSAGDKAGEVLYQRCLERAIRSGTPQGKLLAAAVRQVHTAKNVVPATTKTSKSKAEAPTRDQVLRSDGFPSNQSLDEFFEI